MGTDLQGCSNTDTVTVSVIQSLQISSIPSNPTVCQGEEVNINVSGAFSFSWYPNTGLNNPNSRNVIANPNNSTNYMVIGTDNFGCSDTTFIYVDVLTKPSLTLTNNPSICEGESTPLVVNGLDNYIWFTVSGLNSIIGSTVTG